MRAFCFCSCPAQPRENNADASETMAHVISKSVQIAKLDDVRFNGSGGTVNKPPFKNTHYPQFMGPLLALFDTTPLLHIFNY
jgi:hypothetical protein